MKNWKELYETISEVHENVNAHGGASAEDLLFAEKRLNVKFPEELCALLSEVDGDDWFLLSVGQILETNFEIRKSFDFYMPLDGLLFFAQNGCGDYYGYPVTGQGVNDGRIYFWDHETDDRVWKTSGLEETIVKYYNSEI